MEKKSVSHSLYRWTCVTEKANFAGRDGAGGLVFKGKMWLLGGWNPWDKVNFPKICNSEVWSSTDGRIWKLENPSAPWEGRHCAGYVVHDEKMWILGGDNNQKHYQNDVWNSSDGVNWELVNDNVPWGPRVLHHTVAFNNKIWVMGGQTFPKHVPGIGVLYNDVWCTEDGVKWEKILDRAPWTPRGMIGGSAVHNGRMWLLGGGTSETPQQQARQFNSEVWSSSDGVNWEFHTIAPWHPRQYHEVAVFDGKLWVMEGYYYHIIDGNRNDVWFSEDGVVWEELPGTPWAPRHAATVYVYDNALWIVAGNNMFPDVWKLTRV